MYPEEEINIHNLFGHIREEKAAVFCQNSSHNTATVTNVASQWVLILYCLQMCAPGWFSRYRNCQTPPRAFIANFGVTFTVTFCIEIFQTWQLTQKGLGQLFKVFSTNYISVRINSRTISQIRSRPYFWNSCDFSDCWRFFNVIQSQVQIFTKYIETT